MREFGYKASPEGYPSLLLSLPTAYFYQITQSLRTNDPFIIRKLCRKNPPKENSAAQNFTVQNSHFSISTAENSPSGYNEDSPFYRSFSINKRLVLGSRCSDWSRVFCNIYFYYHFVNRLYSKFNNFFIHFFSCKKKEFKDLYLTFQMLNNKKNISSSYL